MSRKRLVLLARPGAARERTQAAMAGLDVELVAVLDPADASEADVRALAPDALLVVLDPAVEQVLGKFDGLFGDSAIEVMFEDADMAAKREGWEAARWARHLDAKLHGHGNVLPPAKEGSPAPAPDARARAEDTRFREDLDALQMQVAAMPEVPPAPSSNGHPRGAVAIAAGVGGPDAVRQLLAALPVGFPRPVVLRQRIEGGHYDKLVRQMKRASALRVVLAQAGDEVEVGAVHVLPDGLDLRATPAGLAFAATEDAPMFAALPPADSALLLLSGADMTLVDRALALSLAGGLALGQSAENCFDPAASNALVARGGEAVAIAQLSVKLLQRWPA